MTEAWPQVLTLPLIKTQSEKVGAEYTKHFSKIRTCEVGPGGWNLKTRIILEQQQQPQEQQTDNNNNKNWSGMVNRF